MASGNTNITNTSEADPGQGLGFGSGADIGGLGLGLESLGLGMGGLGIRGESLWKSIDAIANQMKDSYSSNTNTNTNTTAPDPNPGSNWFTRPASTSTAGAVTSILWVLTRGVATDLLTTAANSIFTLATQFQYQFDDTTGTNTTTNTVLHTINTIKLLEVLMCITLNLIPIALCVWVLHYFR